ncbi:MAG: phospho-N-acetylmuramoyl-pentapeptide-transferase [Clostridia bacterium]|nr:phospho-N-acetylmuramoyl-pentapeptide-transferase [Clostridia bacterium]
MMLRMMGGMLLSLGIALMAGPFLIRRLNKLHFGTVIYELGPAHQKKQGTPVMGGLMIVLGTFISMLALHPLPWQGGWDLGLGLMGISLLSMAVGFADDWIKAVKKRHEGLTPWQKIFGQAAAAAAFSAWCYFNPQIGSQIRIPFSGAELDLGIWYLPLCAVLIIFYVNSTNLQDGLDGLLGTISAVSFGAWAAVVLVTVLLLGGDRAVYGPAGLFALSLVGGCVGYLRYNRYPAKVFMGDTGSMFLGGAGVGLALVTRQPLLLLLIGFCPVMSSVSVIMQRYYFKATRKFSRDHQGRRIFLMSPVHHHFEKKGYSETQIVAMYAGVTTVLSWIAVLSLIR